MTTTGRNKPSEVPSQTSRYKHKRNKNNEFSWSHTHTHTHTHTKEKAVTLKVYKVYCVIET